MPHFSQYAAYVLLLDPQKMQNLLESESVLGACGVTGSGDTGICSCGMIFVFLTDQMVRTIETTMANAMIMNKSGLSSIRLNDNGIGF